METSRPVLKLLGAVLTAIALQSGSGWAFTAKGVGVVTTLQGTARITHASAPTVAASLRFRDDVFLQDVIDTEAAALARILLRGSSLVTIRELSRVTIGEQAIPTGSKSVVSLFSGKVRATVSRSLLGPGDQTEIRTPNAVAAVRGTDVIVFTVGETTSIGVLDGSAEVTNIPPQRGEPGVEPGSVLLAQAGPGGAIPRLTAQASSVLVIAGQFTQIIGFAPPTPPVAFTPAILGQFLGGLQGSGTRHSSQPLGAEKTLAQQNQAAGQAPPPVTGITGTTVPSGPTVVSSPTSTVTRDTPVTATTNAPLVTQTVSTQQTISGTFTQLASGTYSQGVSCTVCTVTGTISSGSRTDVRPGSFTGTFSSTNTFASPQPFISNPVTIQSSGRVSGLSGGNLSGDIIISYTIPAVPKTYSHLGSVTLEPNGKLTATYSGDIKNEFGVTVGSASNGTMVQIPQ
jgi:hypothetical protein